MKGSEGLLSFMMAPVFVRIHFTIYSVESEFGSTIKFHVQLILAMFDLNHICCRYFKSLWHSWMCCNYANNSRSYGLVWLSWTMDNDLRLGEKRLNKFIPETNYFDPGIVSCSWGCRVGREDVLQLCKQLQILWRGGSRNLFHCHLNSFIRFEFEYTYHILSNFLLCGTRRLLKEILITSLKL